MKSYQIEKPTDKEYNYKKQYIKIFTAAVLFLTMWLLCMISPGIKHGTAYILYKNTDMQYIKQEAVKFYGNCEKSVKTFNNMLK